MISMKKYTSRMINVQMVSKGLVKDLKCEIETPTFKIRKKPKGKEDKNT